MAKSARWQLVIPFVALLASAARAQPASDAPAPSAPSPLAPVAPAPVEPITSGPINGPAPLAAAPLVAPTPSAPADAPPLAPAPAPDNGPFYTKWWFWTAVGAAAVTTMAILIATSGSGPPKTDFGNMPAF